LPQRANAKTTEPLLQKEWQLPEQNENQSNFLLHDGPPYANGKTHVGHALNKVLKDFHNRYWLTQGKNVNFRPGFDCHGLPTEMKVLESLTPEQRTNMNSLELRRLCREYADNAYRQQTTSLQRLGVLADWTNPYLTMSPEYESRQLEGLARMLELNLLYRAEKEVWYSPSTKTALAEAELEYLPNDTNKENPLDWRTKQPVERRMMTQWFVDLSELRSQSESVSEQVDWGNEESKNRFTSMLSARPDWCVSRQRVWGLPLPVFYHNETNQPLLTPETVRHFAQLVAEHSSDCWWSMSNEELLPQTYQTTANEYHRGFDTLDVWMDSGLSWLAVMGENVTADLYLEGSDQHRGWFQSSLLTSVALTGHAPFKKVLTHGFVLDGDGRKMSKSEGNVVDPLDLVEQYSADVFRLWVASCDYSKDVYLSKNSLERSKNNYMKMRQTYRFMLSNLFDFSSEMALESKDLLHEDQKALEAFNQFQQQMHNAYQSSNFAEAHKLLFNYLANDFSKDWLKTETTGLKGRLYLCYENNRNAYERRSGQTALNLVLRGLLELTEPFLPHLTSETKKHF
jgi:isoleucyl-tRNA synthetase